MKSVIRQFVLATCEYPALAGIYRGIYRALVTCFGIWARFHPEVSSLYVRGSFARGDFIPGRSDLDFVLVLSESDADRARFCFLRRFRSGFAKFRRLFPMLGEVEILAEPHLRQWVEQLYDRCQLKPVFNPVIGPVEPPSKLENARQALSDYVFLFLPNLCRWGTMERKRLAQKILKNCGLERQALDSCPWKLASEVSSQVELVCQTFKWEGPSQAWSLESHIANCSLPGCLIPWQSHIEALIQSPFDDSEILVVLVEDRGGCPPGLLQAVCENFARPLIFRRASLICYLNLVSPLQAMSLVADRLVWGAQDPLRNFSFQERYFTQGIKKSAALILSHVHSFEIAPQDLEVVLLGWFFRVKRYLEDDAQEVYFHEILEFYRLSDPVLFKRLQRCLERPDPERDFRLLRILADDLNRSLSTIGAGHQDLEHLIAG